VEEESTSFCGVEYQIYPCYSFVERVYDEKKKKYENCLFYANASYGSGRVIETDIVEISLEQRHSA